MAHIALAAGDQACRGPSTRPTSKIAEFADEPDYVSVKCRDPGGYVVEFAWEPDAQPG
jgi:hypothetical protein